MDDTITATTTPEKTTCDDQWYRVDEQGNADLIEGAPSATYTATIMDVNRYLRVVATGKGDCEGEASAQTASPVSGGFIPTTVVVNEPTHDALEAAIEKVDDGGTIIFSEKCAGKTIKLNGYSIYLTKDVTIDAGNLNITIDAGGSNRVFYIYADSVKLNGLTLTGGSVALRATNSGNGGAIFNRYTDLTVTNCTIVGNKSRDGGAIFNCHGTLTVIDSTIVGNTATRYAGGLYNFGPAATTAIVNSIIAGNNATTDADVYIREGGVSAFYSQISGVYGKFMQSVGTETKAVATDIFVYDKETGALVLENGAAANSIDVAFTDMFADDELELDF
ncbi:MAG: hypothetical protein HUK22_05645 [Thermoguttaceae bacterium]|nr:hypothetical protein [Thermoguttaceae bacterium]